MVNATSKSKAVKKPGPGRTGRPKLPSLDKARREALKALRKLEEENSQFFERLSAPKDDPKRSKQLHAVADLRMAKAVEVNEARERVRQARADVAAKVPGAESRLEAVKKEEEALTRQLRELPELGFTQAEWDDPDIRAMIPKENGRPQLEIEVRRVRAQEEYDEALKVVMAEEKKQGIKHVAIKDLPDPVKNSQGLGIGRPKLDALGLLDRRRVAIEKKIEHIQEEVKSGIIPPLGRTPAAKLKLAREELRKVSDEIAAAEAKLDPVGRLQREVKRLRDERRRLKLIINERPNDCEAELQRRVYLRNEIDKMLMQIAQLGGKDLEPEQPEAPETAPVAIAEQEPKKADQPIKSPAQAGVRAAKPAKTEPVTDQVVPTRPTNAAAAAADSPRARAEMIRRRAQVQAKVAEVDAKYAAIIENFYATLDEETADELASLTEAKRLAERAKVEGIELLQEA